MAEENNKKSLEALNKIEQILNEVRDLFTDIPKVQIEAKLASKKYENPLKILKRVNGIIINYNESNAERKLKSLLNFLAIRSKDK